MRTLLFFTLAFCMALSVSGQVVGDRSGVCPGWLPADEVTAFFPDDAETVRTPVSAPRAWFRWACELPDTPIRRAVAALSGQHALCLQINGVPWLEKWNEHNDALPAFADVTSALRPGTVNRFLLAADAKWEVIAYLQIRVELADGRFLDLCSSGDWEYATELGAGWPRGQAPETGWQAVEAVDDYYGTNDRAGTWFREFALMPRNMIRERMHALTERFNSDWDHDRAQRAPAFADPYVDPAFASRYEHGFLRLDPDSGQVVGTDGRVRHLFLTILSLPESALRVYSCNFDRLEEHLAAMARGEVHVYLRQVGWAELLEADGSWKRCETQPPGSGLPRFEYNYQILDHFLDRCQAHGRYVVMEGDFFWGAHWQTLPPPYHTRYYLYPEVAQVNALAHRKILVRYADRPCVVGYMIGEEDIQMDRDLGNPHLERAFQGFLEREYRDLATLARTWGQGYDLLDTSLRRTQDRASEGWGGLSESVLEPQYPLSEDVFTRFETWQDVRLPVSPLFSLPTEPWTDLPTHRTFEQYTFADPVLIDYNRFRDDHLYLEFVNLWSDIVGKALPNQWLQHSNAQDYTNQWHFLHVFRRADLQFPVVGVGSHDSGSDMAEIPAFERMRKYYRNIAGYRPYVRAPGSPAVGVASGEGEGGRHEHPQEILNYYRAQSFELIGHGAAFELSYTWDHVALWSEDPEHRPQSTPALEWMGRFYRDIEGVPFSLDRDVPVLVVRNNNLQRSNHSGRDYGNAQGLAEHLGQLNVEFDIAMDEDVRFGPAYRKIDIRSYRVVFLPCAEVAYDDGFLDAVEQWLGDPHAQTAPWLVIGYPGTRSPYLVEQQVFQPALSRWLGTDRPAFTLSVRGVQELVWLPLEANGRLEESLTLNVGERDLLEVGVFDSGSPFVTTTAGDPVACHRAYGAGRVVWFGFPLGLAFDRLWGMAQQQTPYNTLARVYEDLVDSAGVPRPLRAPHNLRVAVSDDRSAVFVQERHGIPVRDLCELALPEGTVCDTAELLPAAGGWYLLRSDLGPYEGRYFLLRQE